MAGKKIKIKELLRPQTFVQDALDKVKKDEFGNISPKDMEKVEKEVVNNILQSFEDYTKELLKNGDSLEIPGMMNIGKSVSTVYKNAHGKPKERLTIRTRARFLRLLNNEL